MYDFLFQHTRQIETLQFVPVSDAAVFAVVVFFWNLALQRAPVT